MVGHAKTNAASESRGWRIVGPLLLYSGAARPSPAIKALSIVAILTMLALSIAFLHYVNKSKC
jgi:hypothetical protein